jgi:hypothetical protein
MNWRWRTKLQRFFHTQLDFFLAIFIAMQPVPFPNGATRATTLANRLPINTRLIYAKHPRRDNLKQPQSG